jgi:hypothetical protein
MANKRIIERKTNFHPIQQPKDHRVLKTNRCQFNYKKAIEYRNHIGR